MLRAFFIASVLPLTLAFLAINVYINSQGIPRDDFSGGQVFLGLLIFFGCLALAIPLARFTYAIDAAEQVDKPTEEEVAYEKALQRKRDDLELQERYVAMLNQRGKR